MDDKTLAALCGSIAKWEAIVAGHGLDRGVTNCPLCQMFYRERCAGCPVAECVGDICCRKTPYAVWGRSTGFFKPPLNNLPPEVAARLRPLAQAELDFLRSLLPEGEL